MKIVFISNYMNHHQLSFCKKMRDITNNNFVFIATTSFNDKRKLIGYEDMNNYEDFIVKSYETSENIVESIIENADAILIGSAKNKYIKSAISKEKLVFKISERYFKNISNIRKICTTLRHIIPYNKYHKFYYLCASAYTAYDVNKYCSFNNRVYKWGYFPQRIEYNIDELIDNKDTNRIIWCGRLIKFKHPEVVIDVAKQLKRKKLKFCIHMIGTGELLENIQNMIDRENLSDCIVLRGAMSYKDVRKEMNKSGICLVTSDFCEGWGAVVNEAMNSGCATIASHAAGSVPYLINSFENGIIYKYGDIDNIVNLIEILLCDKDKQKKLGKQAYFTISNQWNADVAGERLYSLIQYLLKNDECKMFKNGPCSEAEIITENWISGVGK